MVVKYDESEKNFFISNECQNRREYKRTLYVLWRDKGYRFKYSPLLYGISKGPRDLPQAKAILSWVELSFNMDIIYTNQIHNDSLISIIGN